MKKSSLKSFLIFLALVWFAFSSKQTHASVYDIVTTYQSDGRVKIEAKVYSYWCGLDQRTPWTRIYFDGQHIGSFGSDLLDGKTGSRTYTAYASNPVPGKKTSVRVEAYYHNGARIQTCDQGGEINRLTVDFTVPSAMGDISLSASNNDIRVSWNPGGIAVNSYTMNYYIEEGGTYKLINTVNPSSSASSYTISNAVRGAKYRVELRQYYDGGSILKTYSGFVMPMLDSWKFTNLQVQENTDNLTVKWSDPSAITSINNATDDWYFKLERQDRYFGQTDNDFGAWKTLSADIGSGNDNNSPKQYTDNTVKDCFVYQYRLTQYVVINNVPVQIHSAIVKMVNPTAEMKPAAPANFRVSGENACVSDKVDLQWELDYNHPCMDLWFRVVRYEVNASGADIASTRKQLAEMKSGTTYGGGGSTNNITRSGNVFRFTDLGVEDNGAACPLEKGKTYRYYLSARTRINANGIISGLNITEADNEVVHFVGGALDEPSSAPEAALVDGENGYITLTWDDIWPNESSVIVKRYFVGTSGLDHTFTLPANTTEFVDRLTGENNPQICTDYQYEISVKNDCETKVIGMVSQTGAGVPLKITKSILDTYPEDALDASKGYHQNFVHLEWSILNNSSSIKRQKIFRKPVNSVGDSVLVATVDGGIRKYDDYEAGANTLYHYYLVGEAECGINPLASNVITAIGFRVPYGMVTGHIEYEGGVSVKDARVMAVKNTGGQLNRSLSFDGVDDHIMVPNNYDAGTGNLLYLYGENEKTIEMWARVDEFNGAGLFSFGSYDLEKGFLALHVPENHASTNWAVATGATDYYVANLNISPGEWHHFALTYRNDTLALYVDGSNISATGKEMKWPVEGGLQTGSDGAGGLNYNHDLTFGRSLNNGIFKYLKGHLDELRIWSVARSGENIAKEHSGFLIGNESGLEIYYRVDEDYGDYVYDVSYVGTDAFHGRHGFLVNGLGQQWSSAVPSSDKLGFTGYTNEDGNYVIKYVKYSGAGDQFSIVPFIVNHKFQPSNRLLYIGTTSPVHNSQDFTDISAFNVTGTVTYGKDVNGDGTISPDERFCPAEGIYVKVDGVIAIKDGEPVMTDANGEFSVSVPIGEHFVSLEASGHTFAVGRYPATGKHDFQQPVSGIEFIDNTQRTVVGKVVGGTAEGAKFSGLGRARNNIGVATLVFKAKKGCFEDTILTDTITGEYSLDLFPMEYEVRGGADISNPEIFIASNSALTFPVQTLDLGKSLPRQTERDSVFADNGQLLRIDSVGFHAVFDLLHREPHSLVVTNHNGGGFAGDSYYEYVDPRNPASRDTIPASLFEYPLMQQNLEYGVTIALKEVYTNYDNPAAPVKDTVAVTDGVITVANNIADMQPYTFDLSSITGDTTIMFHAGTPNLTMSGDPDLDFLKTLEISSEVGLDGHSWAGKAYVFGAKPVGNSFATQGPAVVEHILRDPPGSNSFATIEKGAEYSSNFNWSLVGQNSSSYTAKVKGGVKILVGQGVLTATEVQHTFNTTVGYSLTAGGGGSYAETVSFSEAISTSSDPLMVGADADLFIGKSQNMDFGVSENLEILPVSNCGGEVACNEDSVASKNGKYYRIGRNKGFYINPTGYNTYFVYTQKHIREQVIPDLRRLRNQILETSPHYTVNFTDKNDPKYGSNNDDSRWGSLATSATPLVREIIDFGNDPSKPGPSYRFSKTFSPDEPVTDSVRWINQQIRLWEEALQRNEELKINALDPQNAPEAGNLEDLIAGRQDPNRSSLLVKMPTAKTLEQNISFSAGSSYSRSVSLTSNSAYFSTFEIGVSTEFANETEAKVSNTGIGTSLSMSFGAVYTGGRETSMQYSSTYGFTLADDNIGDFYSVDILDGGQQSGPIFKVRGGETSCPYEGEVKTSYYEKGKTLQPATVPRDRPKISISPSKLVAVPSDEAAVFTLVMGNENSDETRAYFLQLDPESNPNGAIVTIDGLDPNKAFYIPAGGTVTKTVTVRKGPNQNNYENLTFLLYPECDWMQISEQASFSVSFIPTCTKSELLSPKNQWVVNDQNENILPLTLGGYDINFTGLKEIKLRYKPVSSSVWVEQKSFYNKESVGGDSVLISRDLPYTNYDWNISSLVDGKYDIELVSVCENGVERKSEIYTGVIDRLNPHNFGNPSPADGVLSPNDEISIRFNETINAELINKALDIDVRGVLNGTDIAHFTSLYFDGDDYVSVPPMTLGNRSFAVEFWAKRNGKGASIIYSYGNDEMQIGFDENDFMYLKIGNAVITASDAIADSKWHHFALSLDNNNGQGEIIIDGVSRVTAALNNSIATGSNSSLIGSSFSGNVHEFRIWGGTRTVAKVIEDYLYTLNGTESNLIGYWPMDEGAGTMAEDKTGRRPAAIHATWSFAQEGRAVSLDGQDDFFNIKAATLGFDEDADFTVSFWFKGDNGVNTTLFSNGRTENDVDLQKTAWSVQTDAAGILYVKNNGASLRVGSQNYFDGSWHHFALVVNRLGNTDVYMDGELRASTDSDLFSAFAGADLAFGAYRRVEGTVETIDGYFAGSFDEIRIWNLARKQKQIQRDMYFRLKGEEYGLLAYYPFEQYTLDIAGIYNLTETLSDQADRADIGLQPFESSLENGAVFSPVTPAVKIERPVEKVNFTYTVNNDQIIITPNEDPARIEGVTLDITVRRIQDVYGNSMESAVTWIAFVDKSQVKWSEGNFTFDLDLGEGVQFTADVVNTGGESQSFSLGALPAWLTASPASGVVPARSSQKITFTILEGLNIGQYEENIALSTNYGSGEVFDLTVNVSAPAPDWSISATGYEHSMGIVGVLELNGVLSTDVNDKIAAFVDGELRGVANLKHLSGSNSYRVYLDIYSNVPSGEQITFRIWDASTGMILDNVTPGFTFENNSISGTQDNPVVFAAGNTVARSISLKSGWNWISVNVVPENPLVQDVFNSYPATDGDVVKSSEYFDQYSSGLGWIGTVSDNGGINVEESYKVYVANGGTLQLKGTLIDLHNTPVSIIKGWNWIGYLPHRQTSVNTALASYDAVEGDLIKGQKSFAIFDDSEGWIGSLEFLQPGQGYMLMAQNTGTLIYPEQTSFAAKKAAIIIPAEFQVKAEAFEGNMSVVAEIKDAELADPENYLLVCYDKDGILRGSAESVGGKYYLTVHGNYSVDMLRFYVVSADGKESYEVEEALFFEKDRIIGWPETQHFHLKQGYSSKMAGINSGSTFVYPNPVSESFTIFYNSRTEGVVDISICNVLGEKVAEVYNGTVKAGDNTFRFNDARSLTQGVYLVVIEQDGAKEIVKITR